MAHGFGRHPRAVKQSIVEREERARTYDAAQYLRNKQRLHRLGSEEDCGESSNGQKARDDRATISKAFRDDSVEEQADDLSNICTLTGVCKGKLDGLYSRTLLSPACQGAGICQVPSGSCFPYFSLNCGKASGHG